VIPSLLPRLLRGESLTEAEAQAVIGHVMDGDASEAQIAGLLVALRMKGESVDEIVGAARAMRTHAIAVDPEPWPSVSVAVACEPPSFHTPVRTSLNFDAATAQSDSKPFGQSAARAPASTGARAWALATASKPARSRATAPARFQPRLVRPNT